MSIPILTKEVVERIVRAENDVTLARVKSVERVENNALEVDVREFGHVLATMMQHHPERWWNRIGGIAPGDEVLLDEILAWYRAVNLSPTVEVVPCQCTEQLLRALSARRFFQSAFRTVLYGVPELNQPPPPRDVAVREQDNLKLFSDLAAVTGFVPEGDEKFWKQVTRTQFDESRCYIAFVTGEPAAHAAMFIRERVAVFGFGATAEKYRGRGCQIALLRARIADAAKDGCDLVTVQTNPGSVSQRNVERAGLGVAYTKAIWSEV